MVVVVTEPTVTEPVTAPAARTDAPARGSHLERLTAAVATLTAARRAAGALWLAAPAGHARRIVHPRRRVLAIADAAPLSVPATSEPAELAAWAIGVWAHTPGPRRDLADLTGWVDIERSGANTVVRGARLLWGRRLTAAPGVGPAEIARVVERLAAGTLAAGVANGTLVAVSRSAVHLS